MYIYSFVCLPYELFPSMQAKPVNVIGQQSPDYSQAANRNQKSCRIKNPAPSPEFCLSFHRYLYIEIHSLIIRYSLCLVLMSEIH